MTLQDEYKVLTHFNLPYMAPSKSRYEPGGTVKTSDIEQYVARANAAVPDRTAVDSNATPPLTVEGVVEDLIKYGSISADPDAEIHPDNVIPDVNALTAQRVIASALELHKELTEKGIDVPPEIQALVDTYADRTFVSDGDEGRGHDRVVS